MSVSDLILGHLRRDPASVMNGVVLASTFRRVLPLFGLAASRRRHIGALATRLVRLFWQWHRFEVHIRRRRRLPVLVVFGIHHGRSPFASRFQPTAFSKVPLNGGTA